VSVSVSVEPESGAQPIPLHRRRHKPKFFPFIEIIDSLLG